jgi:hypothetical protein
VHRAHAGYYSDLGATADVKVWTNPTSGAAKFASAQDLRRSFGARWATRVIFQVLKELMRHESIDTTLRYYVGRNAQSTAAVLWEAHRATRKAAAPAFAATFADTGDLDRSVEQQEKLPSPDRSAACIE